MTTKIAVIVDDPERLMEFESPYADLLTRARIIPGVLRHETSEVWAKEDGSPTPECRLIDMYLPGYDDANAAARTPEAAEFFPRASELAPGLTRGVFADIEES
jgi:hypothetical protein